jgi:hypothetical protein
MPLSRLPQHLKMSMTAAKSESIFPVIEDLLGANIHSYNGRNWERRSPKCIDYLEEVETLHRQQNQVTVILKLVWTYGIQLWGKASISNIKILEHLQSRDFHMFVDAIWYLSNAVIRSDLQTQTAKNKSVIRTLSTVLAPVYTQTN